MAKKKVVVNKLNPTELYEKALKQWGFDSQKGMLFEEIGELMQVLNKFDRDKASVLNVVDEIADVMIMCEQKDVRNLKSPER